MKIIKVLVDEMPSGCKRCDFCVAKMYCLLLEDRKTTVPDEPYKRRTDCPFVYDFGDRETNALNKRIAELERDFDMLFRAVIAASKQSRKNTQSSTIVYGKEREE